MGKRHLAKHLVFGVILALIFPPFMPTGTQPAQDLAQEPIAAPKDHGRLLDANESQQKLVDAAVEGAFAESLQEDPFPGKSIAVAYLHSCALTAAGGVKCWGSNASGQLGDGTMVNRSSPVDVSGLNAGAIGVATGRNHTCALTTGGGVKCWGFNGYGQLGDGTTTRRTIPVSVSGLSSGVSAISLGNDHTCVLTTGGEAKCWGRNDYGQLGDGTNTQRLTPVSVQGLGSGVGGISVGFVHSCALTTGGGVQCWGHNQYGQVGDGSTTHRNAPVAVSGISAGASSIGVGQWHSCVVMTDGTAKCWGDNSKGQLGDGNQVGVQATPVNVIGLGDASVIAPGEPLTCALTASGGVKCWGMNNQGLGDGTTSHLTPAAFVIGLESGVSAVTADWYHMCARKISGGAKCWGWNSVGQLGDGTTTDRPTPVDVVGFLGGVTYSITGRVTNPGSIPISGVAVSTDSGLSAFTNANGYYTLTNAITGTYTLTPLLSGSTFSPPSRTVSVPPNATGQDFSGVAPISITLIAPITGTTAYQGGSLLVKTVVTQGGQPTLDAPVKGSIPLGGPFAMTFDLNDDGRHEDGAANDGIYANRIGLYGPLAMPSTGNPYPLSVTANAGGLSGSASSSFNVSPSQGAPQVALQIAGPHSPDYYAGDQITLTGIVTYTDSSSHTDTVVSVSIIQPDLTVELVTLNNISTSTWGGMYILPAGVGGKLLFDIHAAPPPGANFVDSWGETTLIVYKSFPSLMVTNPTGTIYVETAVPLKVCAVADGQPVLDAAATAKLMPEDSSVNLNADSNGCYWGYFFPSQSGAYTVTYTVGGNGYKPASASGNFTVSSASTDLGQAITSFTRDYKNYSTDGIRTASRVSEAGDWFSRQFENDKVKLFTDLTFDLLSELTPFSTSLPGVPTGTSLSLPGISVLGENGKVSYTRYMYDLLFAPAEIFTSLYGAWIDDSAMVFYATGGDMDANINQTVREFVSQEYQSKLENQSTGLEVSFFNLLDQKTRNLRVNIDEEANRVIGKLPSLNIDPALRVNYIHDLALRSRANYWMGSEEYTHVSDVLIYRRDVSEWQNLQEEKYGWLKWISENALKWGIYFSPAKLLGYKLTDKALAAFDFYLSWKETADDQRFRDLAIGLMEQGHGTQLYLFTNTFTGLELVSEKTAPTTPAGRILSVDVVRTAPSGPLAFLTRDAYADIQIQNTGADPAEYGVMVYYYSNKPGPFEIRRVLEEMHAPSNGNVLGPTLLYANQNKSIRLYFKESNGADAGIPVAPMNQFIVVLYAVTAQGVYVVDTIDETFSPRTIEIPVNSSQPLALTDGRFKAEVQNSRPLFLASIPDANVDYPVWGRVGNVADSTDKAFHIIVQNPFPQPLAAKVSQSITASVSIVDAGSGVVSGGQIAWYLNLDPHQIVYLDYQFNYTGGYGIEVTLPPVSLDIYSATDNTDVSLKTGDHSFHSGSPLIADAIANMVVAPAITQTVVVTVANQSTQPQNGNIQMSITDTSGNIVAQVSKPITLNGSASQAVQIPYVAPQQGSYLLTIRLAYGDDTTTLLNDLLRVRLNNIYLPITIRNSG